MRRVDDPKVLGNGTGSVSDLNFDKMYARQGSGRSRSPYGYRLGPCQPVPWRTDSYRPCHSSAPNVGLSKNAADGSDGKLSMPGHDGSADPTGGSLGKLHMASFLRNS